MNRSFYRWVNVVSVSLAFSFPAWAIEEEGVTTGEATEAATREGAPKESEVQKKLFEVGQLFSQRKFDEASKKLDEIAETTSNLKDVDSYRAGIYAETGKYEEARLIYERHAQEDPKAFAPRFNLVELKMLQKDYTAARKGFETLHQDFPSVDFVVFKVVLNCIQEKDFSSAQKWAQKLHRGRKNPLIYYSAAALALSQGDFKNGKGLITAAEVEFGPKRHALLYQSLAEIGLVIEGDYPPKP